MARQPRFFAPEVPLHVIQRGNNRSILFAASRDYRFFLDCLGEASRERGLAIHAYVLMTNHVHLLATPRDRDSLPKVMQSVGRRYVQRFNQAHQRTGTLWEGRYKACAIDSERYFFTCMRYVELNPVRAGIVQDPGGYRWSSYQSNAAGATDLLVAPHSIYLQLDRSPAERQGAYARLFGSEISRSDIDAIREATNKNWALGGKSFLAWLKAMSGRRATPARRGRQTPAGSDSNYHNPANRV